MRVVWNAQPSWGALMLGWGKRLNWIHPAREDLRMCKYVVFEIYMLSESNVWFVHGFIGMLPKKVVILSRENISYLLKISELFLNQCFPLLPSTWITWNTENRINSRRLTSLSQPCLLHVHLFTNPKYFPSPLRENDSRDNFAGFFVLFCCPFQYVHTINCSLTWSLWDSWTQRILKVHD